MTIQAPFLMTVMALLLTACALAAGGATQAPGPAGQPFACELLARASGSGTALEARLEAREAFSGSYGLRVRGSGVSIDQGGELSLAAGQSAFLGNATVSSPLSRLEASLTVTAKGRTVSCPLRRS
jgi:hypothetical protein